MTREYDPDSLEIGDDGAVLYLHATDCPSYCDYACNGLAGDRAASEIEARWKAGDLTDAERASAADTREVLRRALDEALARRAVSSPDAPSKNAAGGPEEEA